MLGLTIYLHISICTSTINKLYWQAFGRGILGENPDREILASKSAHVNIATF